MKWIPPFGAESENERYRNAEPTVAGSNPSADFFNTVLDELLAVIVAADMTPSATVTAQLAAAVVSLAERAATSGVTKGGYWFGKTTAAFVVPNPTAAEQNYIDFTTLNTYTAKSDLSGWDQTGTFVPPAGIDFTILITSKFWDIPEQDGQQGGWAQYSHTDDTWTWWPKIISFKDAALTGTPTAPTLSGSSPATQIVNKQSLKNAQNAQDIVSTSASVELTDDKSIYVVDATEATSLTVALDATGLNVSTNSAKTFEIHIKTGATAPVTTWNTIDAWLTDSAIQPVVVNKTAIFAIRVQNIGGTTTIIGNYGGAY